MPRLWATYPDRVDGAIADLEAQNRPDGPPTPPRLPQALAQATVTAPDGPTQVNLTDPAAGLVKGRQGMMAGDNAQAAVARVQLAPPRQPRRRAARRITAIAVVPDADDHGQLVPMRDRGAATTGRGVTTALSDGGYHDGATVALCAERGQRVVMPEAQAKALADPYHKDHFAYDPATETDTCPEEQTLT